MDGGAVGRLGGWRPRRVLGCDHESGPSMNGDRELRREAAPWRAVHAQQPGECSAAVMGLVGLPDRRARMCGQGGRSRVGRQILLAGAAIARASAPLSLKEINDAVLAAGGALPVPLLRDLPAGPAGRASF